MRSRVRTLPSESRWASSLSIDSRPFFEPLRSGYQTIQTIGSKTLKLRLDTFHRNIAEKT